MRRSELEAAWTPVKETTRELTPPGRARQAEVTENGRSGDTRRTLEHPRSTVRFLCMLDTQESERPAGHGRYRRCGKLENPEQLTVKEQVAERPKPLLSLAEVDDGQINDRRQGEAGHPTARRCGVTKQTNGRMDSLSVVDPTDDTLLWDAAQEDVKCKTNLNEWEARPVKRNSADGKNTLCKAGWAFAIRADDPAKMRARLVGAAW